MIERLRIIRGTTDVKREPAAVDCESQLVFGEYFDVERFEDDWAFGRCVHDEFAGYVHREALDANLVQPTHSIGVMRAPLLRRPAFRSAPRDFLSLGSRVRVVEQRNQFCSLDEDAWVYKAHLVEGALHQPDYMAMAEKLVGVPFVWGGRSTFGFDCTGIIQFVLGLAGIPAPRDIPEQVAALGCAVETPQRGDLFFLEKRGGFFHSGLFISETQVVNAGERFAAVGIQEYSEVYNLYRLFEEANGARDQFRAHLRRLPQSETCS